MITVAIIDDEPEVREHIGQYVSTAPDMRCIASYRNAAEALDHIPKLRPDVVLMDINMSGMNGIECTRRLKRALPAVNILMLTVFDDSDQIFQALASGANGYLLKRSPPEKLLEAIREVCAGGSPMSAPIARKVVKSFQAPNPRAAEAAQLSHREQEVLQALARGLAYKQIADQLNVSIHTVRNYIRRVYEKLHVHSSGEALAKYFRSES
jgi:DNA-binding NarL/FixJ family response regulator